MRLDSFTNNCLNVHTYVHNSYSVVLCLIKDQIGPFPSAERSNDQHQEQLPIEDGLTLFSFAEDQAPSGLISGQTVFHEIITLNTERKSCCYVVQLAVFSTCS